MSLFSMRKPRGFHHEYIYYDERKARLKELEEKARRELGLSSPASFRPESLHGAFVHATNHLRKRKEGEQEGKTNLSVRKILLLIMALAILWAMLAQ